MLLDALEVVSQSITNDDQPVLTTSFNANVGSSLSENDLSIINLTTGVTIPPSVIDTTVVSGNIGVTTINTTLSDGEYLATIEAGSVTSTNGLTLIEDEEIEFIVLGGDVSLIRLNVSAIQTAVRTVKVSWRGGMEPEGNETPGSGFHILRSTNGVDFSAYTDVISSRNFYYDYNIGDGRSYSYQVVPFTSAGDSSPLGTASVTLPLAAPTGPTISNLTTSAARFSWQDNSISETGYKVSYRVSGGSSVTETTLAMNTNYIDIASLSALSTYDFTVQALGTWAGNAITSTLAQSSATMIAPPLTSTMQVDATAYTVTGVHASLANPTNASGAPIVGSVKYSFATNPNDLAQDFAHANTDSSNTLDVTQRGSTLIYSRVFDDAGNVTTYTQLSSVIDNDPVVVLHTSTGIYLPTHELDSSNLVPHLYTAPGETTWDITNPPSWANLPDPDQNGKAGDAYGWNFLSGTPNFINNAIQVNQDGTTKRVGAHDADMTAYLLHLIAIPQVVDRVGWAHVKVMFVVAPTMSTTINGTVQTLHPALQYILDRKAEGANIVAIVGLGSYTDRAGAMALRDAGDNGVLAFTATTNENYNYDLAPYNVAESLINASTPKAAFQQEPVGNIIAVTADPNPPSNAFTSYGINSFYFGVEGTNAESWANPAAAGLAAVAVREYMAAHNNALPTWKKVKQTLMSAGDYSAKLGSEMVSPAGYPGRTITHDFVGGARTGGGLLPWYDNRLIKISERLGAIVNEGNPVAVSIEARPVTTLGQTSITFDFIDDSNTVNDWTISWGDGVVQVYSALVARNGVAHGYPSGDSHTYFSTAYANFGTGTSRRVSFAATIAGGVTVNDFTPTSGKDEYRIVRHDDLVTYSMGTKSRTFPATTILSLDVLLGQGSDNFTVDYSGGDPFEGMNPLGAYIRGTQGAGNAVSVIGSSNADTMTVGHAMIYSLPPGYYARTIAVDAPPFLVDASIKRVEVYGRGGDDTLDASGVDFLSDIYLNGESGDDSILGGFGNDTLIGEAGSDHLSSSDGDDLLSGGDGNDLLEGEDGADEFIGGSGSDTLDGGLNPENGLLRDVAIYPSLGGSTAVPMFFSRDAEQNDGPSNDQDYILPSVEIIRGGDGNDTMMLLVGGFVLNGGAGNDTLTGTSLSDTLEGGYGADILNGSDGSDKLYSNGEYDELSEEPPQIDAIHGGDGNDTVLTDSGDDSVFGEGDEDTIYGFLAGNKFLDGGDGDDFITGGFGHDSIEGGEGDDVIDGAAGNDTIIGGEGMDHIYGGADDDQIFAFDGFADTIDGGSGYDWLKDADWIGSVQDAWINVERYPGGPITSLE